MNLMEPCRSSRRALLTARLGAGLTLLTLAPGCAHYYMPVNRLESPEAIGKTPRASTDPDQPAIKRRSGRLELLGIQSGTDLIEEEVEQSPDPETGETPDPLLQSTWINPVFGFAPALTDNIDLTIRIQPSAPLLGRIKYQLSGEPEIRADRGNFSTALSGGAGFLLGRSNGETATMYQLDAAFLLGYRLGARHLISAHPFVGLAGLSRKTTAGNSGSLVQYGGGFGYQYQVESLYTRVELSYALGSYSEAAIKGIYGAALLGFFL